MHNHTRPFSTFIVLLAFFLTVCCQSTVSFALNAEEKAILQEYSSNDWEFGGLNPQCYEYSRSIYRVADPFKIQMAINEIYASYGCRFHDPDIQAYFDSKDWYVGTIAPEDIDPSVFSYHDQYNINIALEVIEMRNNGIPPEDAGHGPSFQYLRGTYLGDHGSVIEIFPYEEVSEVEEKIFEDSASTYLRLAQIQLTSDAFDSIPQLELIQATGCDSDGSFHIVNEDYSFWLPISRSVSGEKFEALYDMNSSKTGEALDASIDKETFIRDTEYNRLAE